MSERPPSTKSPVAVILTLGIWAGLSAVSWWHFSQAIPAALDRVVRITFHFFHAGWMLFWFWGVHTLLSQVMAMTGRSEAKTKADVDVEPQVAILYLTCDDFDANACATCLAQSHARSRLIICDDSRNTASRRAIDKWVHQQTMPISVIRRPTTRGFKAGNLNHVITNAVSEEFILICDADEILPPDFVAKLLPHCQGDGVAFAQARHRCRKTPASTFESILGLTTDIMNTYMLDIKNKYGFVSCYGHGVIIRRSVWVAIGGFPEIVSEDIGFAARALSRGLRGVYVTDVVAEEAFPPTYHSFLTKYRKVTEGTIEFFRREWMSLLRSREATYTEKADLLFTFSACLLPLVAIGNTASGLVVSSLLQRHGYVQLPSWLLAVYLVGPLTPVLPLLIGVFRRPVQYVTYALFSAIGFVSITPVLAKVTVTSLLPSHSPVFPVTGKVARDSQRLCQHLPVVFFGLLLLTASLVWSSPATMPCVTLATMIVLGPTLSFLDRDGLLGLVSRCSPIVPYAVMAWLQQTPR